MDQKRKIDSLVEDTLNSLDGIQRAAANPFLYSKIQARMRGEVKGVWDSVITFVSRPAVALVLFCIVVLSNGVAIYMQRGNEIAPIEQGQLALTEEYNQTATSYFDEETPEP